MAYLEGFENFEKKLKSLEKNVAKKVVRSAVRKAQKTTLQRTKQNASSMVGGEMGQKITDALVVKAIRKQKSGSYSLQVCIDPAKASEFKHITKDGTEYYIPTAIEYGHKKEGGTVPAIPFMKEASDTTEQIRIDTMKNEIKKGIEKNS